MVAAHTHLSNIAGFAIAVAVIADTFDGRFARRFGADPRRSALGVQLDSLADAIAFGIAPPLCSALLFIEFRLKAEATGAGNGPGNGPARRGAVGRHVRPCRMRDHAARVLQRGRDCRRSRGRTADFVGIPVPLAALIWSTALLVQPSAAVTVGLLLATAAAMVLPLRIPRPTGAGLVLFTCWPRRRGRPCTSGCASRRSCRSRLCPCAAPCCRAPARDPGSPPSCRSSRPAARCAPSWGTRSC